MGSKNKKFLNKLHEIVGKREVELSDRRKFEISFKFKIGSFLKEYRNVTNQSINVVAGKLGVTNIELSRMENGADDMSIEQTLFLLNNKLGIDLGLCLED